MNDLMRTVLKAISFHIPFIKIYVDDCFLAVPQNHEIPVLNLFAHRENPLGRPEFHDINLVKFRSRLNSYTTFLMNRLINNYQLIRCENNIHNKKMYFKFPYMKRLLQR